MASKPTEPLSPWAQRYGVIWENDTTLGEDGVRHSGYHTGHPRLDPKFFSEPISQFELENCGLFNHPNDIHRFFYLELKRYAVFRGIKTWQYASLMQYVRFSDRGLLPGGHWRPESKPYRQARHEELADISRLLDGDMITVDEDKWFPFFRRDRWYDLYGLKRVPSGKKWSIDQPKIWEKVRVSVELADRMLKALLNDRHPGLHTILFGTLLTWRDASAMQPCPEPFHDAKVLLSYDFYKSYCDLNGLNCPIDYLANLSTNDWELMLRTFLQNQTWGFTDNPNDNGAHWPEFNGVITLGVNVIDTLIDGDITLAERCQFQYQLARTILHELMHSIGTSRMKHSFPEVPTNGDEPEPFVDFDGTSELGYAMEQRLFGGIVTNLHKTGEYPFASNHLSWPLLSQPNGESGFGYKIGDHPLFSTVQDVIVCPLPALYTSKLLSRSFWEDQSIPRKSDSFFHRSQLLVGRTQFLPGNPLCWEDIAVDRGKLARGEVDPGEPEMVESWRYWRFIWNGLRLKWYQPAKQIWLNSPWAEVNDWDTVSEFAREFRKGNEIRCGQISLRLARRVPWATDADTYRAALFPTSVDWIVHCIGLLMMAATPIRRAPMEETTTEISTILQLHASARAPKLPPVNIVTDCEENTRSVIASELFDPTITGNQFIPNFDHIDILNVLRRALHVVLRANVRISKPWFLEIVRISDILLEHRKRLKSTDPDYHDVLWAPDWDFKIPDYAPDQLAVWDAARREWV